MEWDLIHVNTIEKEVHLGNSFSISESEAIGISCAEKPALSVMYPDTDRAPVILSHSKMYRSPTFVKVFGKEYLAAASMGDGWLYLWDIESKTSKKVFNPKLTKDLNYKAMNIFTLNDCTIGYGERYASFDRSRRVFILKMDKEELTLSSTLRLFTQDDIFDMCYTEVEGGTPCLLLCIPDEGIISVEMVGGKTRWEAGKQQMGEKFDPWSICTDENNTVYVADFFQKAIHLLSAEDGSVIKSIDARHYGMWNLVAVRIHDGHMYVEHKSDDKYVISKFEKNV